MQRSIRIETLGDLAGHGYGLNATCEKCRYRANLDMPGLAVFAQRLRAAFWAIALRSAGSIFCARA
jgi:hypothetical protein